MIWERIWDALSYLSYWGSVLPLVACAVLRILKRDPKPDAWLLSAGFFVSFLADSLAALLAIRGINNWWLSYVFAPLQFGILIAVVAQRREVRTVALTGLLILGLVSALRGTLDSPETLVKVVGGLLVGWLIIDIPTLKRFRIPVLLYCVASIPWLLAMGAVPRIEPVWLWLWAGYLLTRILALGWMTVALWRALPVVEVGHGFGEHQIPRERRAGIRRPRSGHRHVLAAPKQ